jgi:uncharacterized repeat protein (TIGR03803 family)
VHYQKPRPEINTHIEKFLKHFIFAFRRHDMKTVYLSIFWLAAACAATANAQSFSLLHSFVFPAESPNAPLVQGPDGTLYGTASAGGTGGYGTVFKVRPDGTGFTNLYNFQNDGVIHSATVTNSPHGSLFLRLCLP